MTFLQVGRQLPSAQKFLSGQVQNLSGLWPWRLGKVRRREDSLLRYAHQCKLLILSSVNLDNLKTDVLSLSKGGGERIRTSEGIATLVVFKTTALVHYATPPKSAVGTGFEPV